MSVDNLFMRRRTFLKGAGLAAAAPLLGSGPAKAALSPQRIDPQYTESKYTVCDMCFNRCGVIARVRDGKVVHLDPNPYYKKSHGMLCARGAAGVAQLYDPDRLKQPLIRVGNRGEDKWREADWPEALDYTAQRMLEVAEKYQRNGFLFNVGADMQTTFAKRFARAYGSSNVTSQESLCLFSMHRAYLDSFGETVSPDTSQCNYILMPGSNRFEALVTPDSTEIMNMLQRGGKLTVVDPRYTQTAALATDWLQIKPGTDLALALALAHVIITENLFDAAWVAENTNGFEELQAHVQDKTPGWAEAETDIPAATIERVAREMAAAAPKALVYPGRRTSDYPDSSQIRRGWCIINGLLANFDRPGGLLAATSLDASGIAFGDDPIYEGNPFDTVDTGRIPFSFDEVAFECARDAVLTDEPYPVRGWLTFKTNPMMTAPDRDKTLQMINKLDFMVSLDLFKTDTALFADVILPTHCYLERQDPCQTLSAGGLGSCITYRDPVVPPLYNTMNPFDIFKGLAQRMDLGQYFDFSVEDFRNQQLSQLPGAPEEILSKGVFHPEGQKVYGLYEGTRLRTRSGKVELNSAYYERYNGNRRRIMEVDPLPIYHAPTPVPEGSFRLIGGRNACITQSSSQNNALLAEYVPTNTLHMHPDAAAKLGLTDGDLVEVRGNNNQERLGLEFNTGIRADCVYMHSGFGGISPGMSRQYQNGASFVALVPDTPDQLSGNSAHFVGIVQVAKV